jgi:hypothetical protein
MYPLSFFLCLSLLAGFVPAIEANVLLENKPIGSFLIRFSKTKPGSFAVTFVDHTKQIKHVLLYNADPSGVTLKTPPTVYPTLNAFTAGHSSKLKWPVGTKAINELASEASSSRSVRETHPAQQQQQQQQAPPSYHQPSASNQTNPTGMMNNLSLEEGDNPPPSYTLPSTNDMKARYEEPDLTTNTIRGPMRPGSPAKGGSDAVPPPYTAPAATTAPSGPSPKAETCVICLDAPRETVFLECGHMVACRQCATLVSDCPICRQKIVRVIPVFKA